MEAVERAAEELYGAPLDEFVARRGEWARRLREDGDRKAAEHVRRLPKPSVAAWAVNRLARTRPDEVRDLLEAGAELRRVQEWLLRREADPHDLRTAVEAERAAVGRLAHAAAEMLESAGRRAGPAVLERIAETLHAGAADPEVGELLRRGMLVEDRAAVGLGLESGAVGQWGGEAAESEAEVEASEPVGQRGRGARAERLAAAALEKAEDDARAAAARRKEAERGAKRARAGLVAAEATSVEAQSALDRARAQLAEAERNAAEAQAEADAAAQRAEGLRGEQAD